MSDESSWESLAPWEKAAEWENSAPDIAQELREQARLTAIQLRELTSLRQAHDMKMETRLWATQVVALLIGALEVVLLAVVAWRYADAGNATPGLLVAGAGSALTAAVYGTSRSMSKALSGRRGNLALPSSPAGPPSG